MKKWFLMASMSVAFSVSSALAQLPASPWDTAEFDAAVKASATTSTTQSTGGADVGHIKAETQRVNIPSIKYNPKNADAEAPVYVPAIDSQGNAKTGVAVRSIKSVNSPSAAPARSVALGNVNNGANNPNNGSWRGSGIYGNLDYTGNVTTYDTAVGQEMIAPEVNTHNMNKMIQHLRNLGYKIPESYDSKFQNFTKDYAKNLRKAYDGLGHQHNPFDTMFSGFLDVVEDQSGLDMENLLFNSVDLMSKD